MLLLLGTAGGALPAGAQTARVNGFVTDRTNGKAIELVNVVLDGGGDNLLGAITNLDGLYQITRIPPGQYVLRASFVGYHTHTDTLALEAGEVLTLNIALAPDETSLEEVVVQGERVEGAARVTAGQQTVRPAEISLIPSPDISADLAAYLSTLPITVSTGDRGGQLFIRGGEPSQNLVLLDGILIYQPFHIFGYYSAFPADILSRSDVYAGGFGSRFGERISSVIDVRSREGNKQQLSAAVSVSPFISAARLEGPIVPGHVSLLASGRRSMIEQWAEPLVDRNMPFAFDDAFVKLHADAGKRHRLSVTALQTNDRGTIREDTDDLSEEQIDWRNRAVGFRWLMLPRVLSVSAEIRVSLSQLESTFGPPGPAQRTTSIQNGQLAFDATFVGEKIDTDAGFALRIISGENALGGFFQNIENRGFGINHFAFYAEPEITIGDFRFRPGARLEFYSIRVDPYFEPRLRLVWARGPHQISTAAGIYHQEIVGIVDQRDAANVFTAWINVPKRNPGETDILAQNIPRAIHGILGYRVTPSPRLELSIEGYYKHLDNLFVPEWSSYPRLTSRLQPAVGRAFGFDTRIEIRRDPFYGYINYGLSSTLYESKQESITLWYGTEKPRYRPPHDRRHQVNALLNVNLFDFDVSARWEFGSGLPFSRPIGFDGFVFVDDVNLGFDTPRTRRVIYERPFNAVLPTYHRLDFSVERTFTLSHASITLLGSLINAYDRRNIFYVDLFTLQRTDQLPFVPSIGMRVAFN